MTTENTWRRWVMFADWCCFTDGTADTDHSVILDASLVFLFVWFFFNYYKKMDFISGQFSVLCIHDFLRSAWCLHFLCKKQKNVPGEKETKMSWGKKERFVQQNTVWMKQSSQNVRTKSFPWHLFKQQIHLLSWDFSRTALSALTWYLILNSNICLYHL